MIDLNIQGLNVLVDRLRNRINDAQRSIGLLWWAWAILAGFVVYLYVRKP